ncbi:thioredoxin domain-containing protein [Bdellovibrio bacteriovorus]|uniref:cytochrome c biogenesis protein CcdA n=1 Tax=Bdellovibrio bacteriovorus TaxID=959 RepID=UPI0021D187C0|nr:cytochrome c biogenesis protein CcdA [Bdellovibrio bacteriovorus]UXR63747.1 thioredoxin domain-containing protein [Bdellovibrio bacteriovorus]
MELSLIGVFGAGLLTFFSPCVLPMVPIIAANYLMAGNASRFARLQSTGLFALGFMTTFTLMGLSLPFVSDFLGEAKGPLLIVSAIVIFLYGLKMSGMAFQNSDGSRLLSWLGRSAYLPNVQKYLPKSLHGFLFGATFGLAWTPCVGPILGGVLSYVATKDRSLGESVALMTSFALGIVVPFLALAIGGDLVQGRLNRLRPYLPRIERATGYGLILVAFVILTQSNLPSLVSEDGTHEQITFVTPNGPTNLESVAPNAAKLLFFHTETCPVCHQMEAYLPQVEKECNSSSFQIVRVNVSLPENQAIASKFNIRAVPTMSLISPAGDEIAHTVGYQSEISLRKAIDALPNTSCQNTALNKAPAPVENIPEGQSCDPHKSSGNGLTC